MEAIPQSADCCACCDDAIETQIPGPDGAAGSAGADGADGSDGVSPWTDTSADFTMPAEGATVVVTVLDNTWMFVGQIVQVEGAGWMEVTSIPGGSTTSVTLENIEDTPTSAYPDNVAPGTVISSGAQVIPSGPQGPAGAGTGAPSTCSFWTRTAEAGLSAETNMSALSTGYLKVTTATGVPTSTATIPLADINTGAAPTTQVLKPNGAGVAIAGQVEDDEIEYEETAIAAAAIDWSLGRSFYKLLAANTAFTFSNTVIGKQIRVLLKQGAGTAWTATWPAGLKWAGG